MQGKTHNPGFLAIVNEAKKHIHQSDIYGYLKMREEGEEHLLVDVREESEWAAGRAAGAIHLSKGIIERDIETRIPDHNSTIVLYCGGGFRSAIVADNLTRMGYTKVISLDGGWRAIEASGIPIER